VKADTALPGNHYCTKHQGDAGRYADQNCDLCKAEAATRDAVSRAEKAEYDAALQRAVVAELVDEQRKLRSERDTALAQIEQERLAVQSEARRAEEAEDKLAVIKRELQRAYDVLDVVASTAERLRALHGV